MYEPYPEEVLKENREMPEGFLPYDGRFVTPRLHVGNNCKCQTPGVMHPGHHQIVPDPAGETEESVDLAEARKASHVKHKRHDE